MAKFGRDVKRRFSKIEKRSTGWYSLKTCAKIFVINLKADSAPILFASVWFISGFTSWLYFWVCLLNLSYLHFFCLSFRSLMNLYLCRWISSRRSWLLGESSQPLPRPQLVQQVLLPPYMPIIVEERLPFPSESWTWPCNHHLQPVLGFYNPLGYNKEYDWHVGALNIVLKLSS
jgi:hypothetical protein